MAEGEGQGDGGFAGQGGGAPQGTGEPQGAPPQGHDAGPRQDPTKDPQSLHPQNPDEPQGQGDQKGQQKGFADPGDGGSKPAEPQGQGAPEAYGEFKMPEGVTADTLDQEMFSELQAEFKELGLSQEQAQARFENLYRWYSKVNEGAEQQWAENVQQWAQATAQAGLNSEQSMRQASQGLAQVDGTGELRQIMHNLGLDQHPGIMRVFASYGERYTQDTGTSPGSGQGTGQGNVGNLSPHQKIWGPGAHA